MNYNDSERIKTVFESFGLEQTDNYNQADYIVLNSCAVRRSAEQKLLGFGKQLHAIKKENDGKKPFVIMTGCIIKTGINERVRSKPTKKIQHEWEKIDWIDKALPIKYIFKFIENTLLEDKRIKRKVKRNFNKSYLEIPAKADSSFFGYVPISSGCNHHCTYCTVPFSRGREEFRKFEDIKNEFESYVKKGYKQIVLLGQTVNKWLNPELDYEPKYRYWPKVWDKSPCSLKNLQKKPDNFLKLLETLDSIDGDYWLNFISSYPNYFNKEVIDYIVQSIRSNSGHINPSIHLAVQSGDNDVLKSMARHHTVEEFVKIVSEFKKAIPDISITTDIIVGFSGETEKQFLNTAKLLEDITFDMVFISEYSVRPDTPAENIEDDIPKAEKKKRKEYLNQILEKKLRAKNKKMVGQTHKALVVDRLHNNLLSRSEYGKDVEIINIENDPNFGKCVGKFVEVKIESATAWNMRGKITKSRMKNIEY